MASRFKDDPYVVCPHYRKEATIEIRCTGMCGSHTTHIFETEKAKKEFKEDFCTGYFWNCPCYIALVTDER